MEWVVVEWVAVENLRSAELHCQYRALSLFPLPSSLLLFLSRFSRALYISLYRSLRDEAFVARSWCDAVRRCAARALREKPTRASARAHMYTRVSVSLPLSFSLSSVPWRGGDCDGENAAYPSVLSRFGRFVGPAIYGRIRSGCTPAMCRPTHSRGPAARFALFHAPSLPRPLAPALFLRADHGYQAEMAIYFTGLALRR